MQTTKATKTGYVLHKQNLDRDQEEGKSDIHTYHQQNHHKNFLRNYSKGTLTKRMQMKRTQRKNRRVIKK